VEAHLSGDESPLVWLELDLDQQLNYAQGLVVLTDRRLLSVGPLEGETKSGTPLDNGLQSWKIDSSLVLRAREQGGAGILELIGPMSRLHHWRFTSGKVNAAHRLALRFERLQEGDQGDEDDSAEYLAAVCPSCGALLGPEQISCPECEAAKAKPPIQSLWRLSRFAKPRALAILFGFSLMLACNAATLLSMYLTRPMVNDIVAGIFRYIPLYLSLYAGAAIVAWLLAWARTYVLAWVSERIFADLRNQTYSHLQTLSLEYFGGKRTGDLIARVSNDTDRINYFLSVYLLDFANDIVMLFMIAATLLTIDVKLALVSLLPLPIIAYLVHKVRSRLRQGFQLGSRTWGEMTSILADTIPGIRVVKAFAQERREIDRFRRASDQVFQANVRINRLWSFFGSTVTYLTDVGVLIVWVYGVYRVYQAFLIDPRYIDLGALLLFVGYIQRFYSRLDSMSRIVSAVQRSAASTQRIFSILDRVPSVAEPIHPVHPGRLRGELEFRNVSFHYGALPVLRELNLKIQPGEMIGLVGHSGAGKTTLINLICRFYDASEGAILADGTDIRSYPIEEYRSHIGIVLQEPFLFYGTIAENIAYGRPDAPQEEIIAVARAARAHEFILRLPDGYDSLVGERGQSLSGGERQRISIARALLIDPRILILDEATSSVDTETEREIQLALENLIQGRTTIAIAHRLSTLRRADRLVVIERGRITEIGHHDELLKTQGIYARLYKAQVDMTHGHATISTQ
jgi:ATP-binding cassette subfamily B protein